MRPAQTEESVPAGSGLPNRVAALDGLRGLAVAAVVAYHLRLAGFEAGFLGVDLFFVISGFIITARLLDEHGRTGRIDLPGFYRRRLWRLMPAVLVLVLLAFPITAVFAPDALPRLASDAPAALVYLSNVWQLWSVQSYFETMGRDPVLRHLWSLSVEQHYYLLWPALMVVLLRWRGLGLVALVAVLLAAASTAEMARLYTAGPLAANFTYLATHTHAMGLLAGSALGVLAHRRGWLVGATAGHEGRGLRAFSALAGLLALAGLGTMVHAWHSATPALYLGGFLLASLLAAVAIASAVAHEGAWSRLLGCAPLRWLGTRSYSIYLWHWPIGVWVFDGPGQAEPSMGGALVVVGLTALAAEISYRWIELDARRLVQGWRERLTPALGGAGLWAGSAAAVGAAALLVPAAASLPAPGFAADAVAAAEPASLRTPAPREADAAEPPAAATAPPVVLSVSATTVPALSGSGRDITIIGDSVMLGARHYLARALPGVRVDAAVGRQFSEAPQRIGELREHDALGRTVVLHLGTNGYIVERHLRSALRLLQDRQRVVLIDVHAARRWTEQNNEIVARVAGEFPNVVRVDWATLGRDNPQFFVSDGIHLNSAGMSALAGALAEAAGVPLFEPSAMARAGQGIRLKATRATERLRAAPTEAVEDRPAVVTVPAVDADAESHQGL